MLEKKPARMKKISNENKSLKVELGWLPLIEGTSFAPGGQVSTELQFLAEYNLE